MGKRAQLAALNLIIRATLKYPNIFLICQEMHAVQDEIRLALSIQKPLLNHISATVHHVP